MSKPTIVQAFIGTRHIEITTSCESDAMTLKYMLRNSSVVTGVNIITPIWEGVYPGMCLRPEECRGKTHCPRNPSCCD